MAKKKPTKEYDDFDELPDESFVDPLEEYEEIEFKNNSHKRYSGSSRRYEKLKEKRGLNRLPGNDFNDWDNINDWHYSDDSYDPNY